MIILTAIENNNGLLFNHRRVSKDRILRSRILDISSSAHLLMNEFSAKQFKEGLPDNVVIAEDFLDIAQAGDYVFVEDKHILPYVNQIEAIYFFHWNRDYPSDFKLDLVPSEDNGFQPVKTADFVGSSHEKITEEVWKRNTRNTGTSDAAEE